MTVEGSDIATSVDGVSVLSNPPIISVTSPGGVPTMEEHIDLVTSTDPCVNTDDSIDMQDGATCVTRKLKLTLTNLTWRKQTGTVRWKWWRS